MALEALAGRHVRRLRERRKPEQTAPACAALAPHSPPGSRQTEAPRLLFFSDHGRVAGTQRTFAGSQMVAVTYVCISVKCIHAFFLLYTGFILLSFCCTYCNANGALWPFSRSFTQMRALPPELRRFNEFVTNGIETDLRPEQIKKFLANLRPTNRKHGTATNRQQLNAVNGKQKIK
jgi:hypothetical protein